MGRLRYENPVEAAVGLAGASALLVDARTKHRPAVFVEAGRRYLFDTRGLHVDALRVGAPGWAVGGFLSMTALSAPVGRELVLGVEPVVRLPGATVGIELFHYALSLPRFARAHLTTIGMRGAIPLRSWLVVAYSMAGVRVAGEQHPGADNALQVAVLDPFVVVAGLRLSRDGAVEASIGSLLPLGRALTIAAGYDDATGVLKAAARVGARVVTLSVGASLHPLLGVSKSLSVTWQR